MAYLATVRNVQTALRAIEMAYLATVRNVQTALCAIAGSQTMLW